MRYQAKRRWQVDGRDITREAGAVKFLDDTEAGRGAAKRGTQAAAKAARKKTKAAETTINNGSGHDGSGKERRQGQYEREEGYQTNGAGRH